ncbi:MAG: BrnT family toxin [Thiomargarita sp.]|nr:BrnT family toxin [Thiomargarita sp.]
MRFQFDPTKAKSNLKKHKVSFADAEGIFYDNLAIHEKEPYFEEESRFIGIGMGNAAQILVVIYTLRGEEIRLISARCATYREIKCYEG